MTIHWQDDHLQTTHDLSVLRASAYDKSTRRKRKHVPISWNDSSAKNIPSFQFDSLTDKANLLTLFLAIRDYGFAKVSNVPTTPGTVKSLAKYFGTVLVTNYGEIFDVKTTVNVELGSNTGVYLGPHTDEARKLINQKRHHYNTVRPHSSLNYQTPWHLLNKQHKMILSHPLLGNNSGERSIEAHSLQAFTT